jgi:mannose-6-phosphate isomerase-like protein (cupin superfamily)
MAIENIKRGDFIVELKPGYSYFKQVTSPQIGAFGEKDLSGMDFSLGWSFLTEPFMMVAEAHKHDFDQLLFFMGGDPNNVVDYDAEIEIGLDDTLHTINYPACIRIPKGLMHCPLNIKTVNKPLMFIDITLSPYPSVRPQPSDSKRD